MPIKYDRKLVFFSRELRKNMTPCESKLWYEYLSKYPVRFQRQKPIGEYIADFYCHRARLIIEIDGQSHFREIRKSYDGSRTESLEKQGFYVLRIINGDVENHFSKVCELIDKTVKDRLGRQEV